MVIQITCCCRYACYYLTRNSLTYTAPVMTADPALKMDITQVGTMTSIFPIAYGFSKFLSGVLGARTSPRIMLAGGLMATAIVNILFGFGHSMVWFCSFWALNGVLQVMPDKFRCSCCRVQAKCVSDCVVIMNTAHHVPVTCRVSVGRAAHVS